MKKIIVLFVAALVAGQTAFAQSKGEMYLGGGLTLTAGSASTKIAAEGSSLSESSPLSTTFSIAPSFGYFIADNIRLSASMNFGIESQKAENMKSSTSTFLIGPEVAYYLRLTDNLFYTPELGIYGGVATESFKEDSLKESVSMGAFGLSLNIAQIEFRPYDKLGISVNVMNLQYVRMAKTIEGIRMATGTFKYNISASVAVRYYF